ncbi:MAG: tRNA lysidine(34) synthetase TilS [Planctomycetes bacterium]|nr:tRNA lysidine(34) synthetase TilS [Planctomycetota bacterium]
MQQSIEKDILAMATQTIDAFNMLYNGDSIVVSASAGPDSTALLDILNTLSKEKRWKIHVAHLNHKIRGAESDADAEFVKNLALKYGLPFTIESIDIPSLAEKSTDSLENIAREQRYMFLKYVAETVGANKVATGHTIDDQAETVLLRLMRGTGLRGLQGILHVRRITKRSPILVIRPLLEIDKELILGYLTQKKIDYRIDSTNLTNHYLRNKVRNTLIPKLQEEYNLEISTLLAQLANQSAEMFSYFEAEVSGALRRIIVEEEDNRITLDAKHLAREHIFLQTNIITSAITLLKGNTTGITYKHYRSILNLLEKNGSCAEAQLPGKISILKEYDRLIIHYGPLNESKLEEAFISNLRIPGITLIPELSLEIKTEIINASSFDFENFKKHKTEMEEVIDHDKLFQQLAVRLRRKGDTFQPLGSTGSKKLKKLFIDKKIPASKRHETPIISCGNDIIWVVGCQLDRRFCITKSTNNILKLTANYLKLV